MGTVYRGWQLSVDREVAIKVIHPKLSNDRSAVKRFLREARLASRLRQPNIVNVYDFGQSGGVLYLVMELLARSHARERARPRPAHSTEAHRHDRRAAVRRARGRARAGHRSPRSQARQHRHPRRSAGPRLIKVLDFGLAKSLDAGLGRRSSRTPTRCSARRSTWRPSRSTARERSRAPTSTRSVACSTRC